MSKNDQAIAIIVPLSVILFFIFILVFHKMDLDHKKWVIRHKVIVCPKCGQENLIKD